MINDTHDDHPQPTSDPRAAAYERPLPEQSPYQQCLASVRAAANPLFEAAAPLLRALSDIPSRLDPEGAYLLRRLLDREVLRFQSLCKDAQIRHEHHIAASYAMCTAIDEAAGSTDWGGGRQGEVGLWSGDQLAIRFHGDNKGGDKVFLLLGRLAASPQQHVDLIEVLYALLGLGFEGRYGAGGASDARRQLDTVRHRIFFLLAAARAEVPVALSPHGRVRLERSRRPVTPAACSAPCTPCLWAGRWGFICWYWRGCSSVTGFSSAASRSRCLQPSTPWVRCSRRRGWPMLIPCGSSLCSKTK